MAGGGAGDKKQAEAEIAALSKQISAADTAYFQHDAPEISDA